MLSNIIFTPVFKSTSPQFDNARSQLSIAWSDRHRTVHSLAWLLERSFRPAAQAAYRRHGERPARRAWTPATFAAVAQHQRFQFADVVGTADGLRAWLRHMAVHGVAFIRNAPLNADAIPQLASSVAFIRPMHYGTGAFHVRHQPGAAATTLSYLATPLQLHTDLPYYRHVPGVNLLHCLRQTAAAGSADNLLVDALTVVERLRREWPADLERLARIPVDWVDVGADGGRRFDKRLRAPVVELDPESGELRCVRFSGPQRDSRFTCAAADVDGWYRAQARFGRIAHEEAVRFKTQPGDILTFDNSRMVHGRTAYVDVAATERRHLVGAFLDWDEMYSRLRVLESDISLSADPKSSHS